MANAFQNFRRPVVYILDQELRKRDLKNKVKLGSSSYDGYLSMYPMELIRDSTTGKIIKCLHGVGVEQWFEEFIRIDGKVAQIITTYPDGTSDTLQLLRDPTIHYIEEV